MTKTLSHISLFGAILAFAVIFEPSIALADFSDTLTNVQDKLIETILPVLAVIGLVLAGISFATGNPNARQHILYAIIGSLVGFGAKGIVDFIKTLIG